MKTFVIVGIGKSGLAAKSLLLATGHASDTVFTFDEKNPAADYATWEPLSELPVGTLVVSPGVPLSSPGLIHLQNKGWNLTSEINLACAYLKDEVLIGITGSVGKSTVTSLLGASLQKDDPHAFVGGNLGIPFCEYALQVVNGKPRARYVALELSSYQLENCSALHLDYSAITFLSANHLERYPSTDAYYQTKCNIGKFTRNFCVLNSSSSDLVRYQNKILCQKILVNHKNLTETPTLIGDHNLDNVAVALTLANLLHLSETAKKKLLQFSGLSHRLETVGRFNETLFINDSKATAMDSVLVATQAALTQVSKGSRLHLLLGGKDKNLPWEDLKILEKENNINFLFFGHCGELAKTKSQLNGYVFPQLGLALQAVFSLVQKGDVVLLSPGGTSLDEFKNFEERGNYFKEIVKKNYQN